MEQSKWNRALDKIEEVENKTKTHWEELERLQQEIEKEFERQKEAHDNLQRRIELLWRFDPINKGLTTDAEFDEMTALVLEGFSNLPEVKSRDN